jgi:hypothetical protein
MYENSSLKYFLVWIDPATGDVTKIGNGSTLMAGAGSATIDQANRRYIFCNYNLSGFYLYAMDLVTGNLIYNNLIPIDAGDNVGDMEYDNATQKLYGIHRDANIVWPLALDLLSFDAQLKGRSTAAVSWKILDVAGDEQFELEHSTDGKIFTSIATIKAQKGKENYSFGHEMTASSNYYRLRTTEISGRSAYSKVARVLLPAAITNVGLLPNIITGNATLHITSSGSDKADLVITDATGRLVYKNAHELQKGKNAVMLDLSSVAGGSYTLHVDVNNKATVPLKFVKL